MSYRAISSVTKVSHGSVSAERAAMKREALELKKKIDSQAQAEKELEELAGRFPEIPKPEQKTSVT